MSVANALFGGVRTPLATLCVVGVLVTPLVAHAVAPAEQASTPATTRVDAVTVHDDVGQLRALPLLQPNGVVERSFPQGRGLESTQRIITAGNELASESGLGPALPDFWAVVEHAKNQPDAGTPFPYHYPGLQDLERALTPDLIATHRDDLLELVGLLMLAAAYHAHSSDALALSGPAAETLLQAMAVALPADCDVRLSLAWAVGLGDTPTSSAQKQVFDAADRACRGAPTARWLEGHRQIDDSIRGAGMYVIGHSRARLLRRPLDFFGTWLRRDPGSVLAHAGMGDALLAQAQNMHAAGTMPFTARAYAKRAEAYYRQAQGMSPHPEFLVGGAEARAVEGLPRDGLEVMRRALVREPVPRAFALAEVLMEHAAHRFGEAASTAQAVGDPAPTLRLVYAYNQTGPVGAPPVWLGSVDARPSQIVDVTQGEYGAGSVDWLGFIPDYRRDGVAGPGTPECSAEQVLRNQVLAHDSAAALRTEIPGTVACQYVPMNQLWAVAADEAGDARTRDYLLHDRLSWGQDQLQETEQNLWRYAGDLPAAQQVATRWTASSDSALAWQRLGEIQFLRKHYPDSSHSFDRALARTGDSGGQGSTIGPDRHEIDLMKGLALEKAGEDDQALEAYAVAARGDDTTATVVNAESRIGQIWMSRKRADRALPYLRRAAKLARDHDVLIGGPSPGRIDLLDVDHPPASGAEANDLAVALLDRGDDPTSAVASAQDALAHDPESPVFLDTLAQAQLASGDERAASRTSRRVVARDTTSFQTLNNLGVLEAGHGRPAAALAQFRRAVAADPTYALAWFNLGVVLGRSNDPVRFVQSQAALARAIRLDSSLREEPQDLRADTSSVITHLDVSRPIAPGWTLTSTAQTPVQGLTWLLFVLAAWRLLLSLGLDKAGELAGTRVFGGTWRTGRRWRGLWAGFNRFTPLALALPACVAIAAWPFLGGPTVGLDASLVVLAGMVGLAWFYVAVPRRLRRTRHADGAVTHRGWVPGMAFGAASAVIGYAFVPLPVNDDEHAPPRERWAGPVVLAVFAALGLLIGLVTGFPVVRLLGLGAFAMLTTSLFPMKPYDGGFASNRPLETLTSVALLAVSSALVLGWL